MADEAPQPPLGARQNLTPPGLRPRGESIGRIALILSAIWLVLIGAYAIGFFFGGAAAPEARPQGLTVLLFLLGAVGPVALFGFAALMLERAEALRAEIAALRGAAPATGDAAEGRFARQAAEQARASAARLAAIETTLAAIATRLDAHDAEAQAAPRAARRTAAQPAAGPSEQAALPLGDAAAPPPRIPWSDIVRALDFPRDADDTAGFDAVRSAIRDPEIAKLLQAAEDVLGILAADGLHMEDFAPEHASLAAWRSYGEGARGARAAAVGGIRDAEAVDRVRTRLRADAVFRDATLVLVRRWNQLIGRVLTEIGEDPLLRDLADTRAGRAFMLTARATGAFD